jgi:hypothetical protein
MGVLDAASSSVLVGSTMVVSLAGDAAAAVMVILRECTVDSMCGCSKLIFVSLALGAAGWWQVVPAHGYGAMTVGFYVRIFCGEPQKWRALKTCS